MKKMLLALFFICTNWAVAAADTVHPLSALHLDHPPTRVATLDWALSETVMSLGVTPVAASDTQNYNQWVSKPSLPDSVADLGSRTEPNVELLTKLKPDLILISSYLLPAYDTLSRIAPVAVVDIYNDSQTPLANAEQLTRELGQILNREQQAEDLIKQTRQHLQDNGAKLRQAGADDRNLMFIRFVNKQTLRIHGKGSLINDTITQMGLHNEWQQATNSWGFATTEISKIAEHQDTRVLIFGPLRPKDREALTQSPLWQAMAFTRNKQVYELPAIWSFGSLIAARRLSDNITRLLTEQP